MSATLSEAEGPARKDTRFLTTSVGLAAGKVVSLGVGFLFWVLAAHAARVEDVGLAAGAVSLMMLATQLAIAGTGSAFILRHREQRRVHELLDTAVTVVLLASAAAACTALTVVVLTMEALRPVATSPTFAALFVLMSVLGTLGILLDHVSVAFGRGEQVLVRNTVGGLVTAAPLLLAPVFGWRLPAEQLFALWVLGAGAACGLAARQLSSQLGGYRYRPRLSRRLVAVLLRTGLPNHALTLVERAPNLLLPVVVTEVLSPELNAYWYIAWMMAWAVLVIPVSIGVALLAQVSAAAGSALRTDVLRAGRVGLSLGALAAVVVAVAAPPVLTLLGKEFRLEGLGPLRVLLLGLLPVLVLQLYYAVCRSTGHLREALLTGALCGAGALSVTGYVAAHHGLTGMAAAWVVVQCLAGVFAAARLRRLVPHGAAGPAAPDGAVRPASGASVVPAAGPLSGGRRSTS